MGEAGQGGYIKEIFVMINRMYKVGRMSERDGLPACFVIDNGFAPCFVHSLFAEKTKHDLWNLIAMFYAENNLYDNENLNIVSR